MLNNDEPKGLFEIKYYQAEGYILNISNIFLYYKDFLSKI